MSNDNGDDDLKPVDINDLFGQVFKRMDSAAQRAVDAATTEMAAKTQLAFEDFKQLTTPETREAMDKLHTVEISNWELLTIAQLSGSFNTRRVEQAMEGGACPCTNCILRTVLPGRFVERAVAKLNAEGVPHPRREEINRVDEIRYAQQEQAQAGTKPN